MFWFRHIILFARVFICKFQISPLRKALNMQKEVNLGGSNIKRPRAPNYSGAEKETLLSLVSEFKDILENKKTDTVTNMDKKKTWQKIAEKYNAVSPNMVYRSMESLKKYYEHLKEDLRKRTADKKKEMYKTGGGPIKIISQETDDLLLSVINEKSIYGLSSSYDSDSDRLTRQDNQNDENQEDQHLESIDSTNSTTAIEIVFEDLMESKKTPEEGVSRSIDKNDDLQHTWRKTKPVDLKKPKNKILQRNIHRVRSTSKDFTRRRPAIQTLTSSKLGEKYESLVDKKLELIQCYKIEHQLRVESLKLDLELKKKQLSLSEEK